MRKIVKELEFWVSNVSDKNVSVGDLFLTIPARKHVNLLDQKHYHFNLEQLEKSAESGSLFKKSDKLKVRQVPPEIPVTPGIQVNKLPLFLAKNKLRSTIVIQDEVYEELAVSEESFADEFTKE